MLHCISAVDQPLFKIIRKKRRDLEDGRRSPAMVSVFAEINFFFDRDRGWSNLFHTVGSVSIKIRKNAEAIRHRAESDERATRSKKDLRSF